MASYWIYICTENPINRYAVSRNEYVDMQLEKKRRKNEHHNDNTSSSDNTSDESDK